MYKELLISAPRSLSRGWGGAWEQSREGVFFCLASFKPCLFPSAEAAVQRSPCLGSLLQEVDCNWLQVGARVGVVAWALTVWREGGSVCLSFMQVT